MIQIGDKQVYEENDDWLIMTRVVDHVCTDHDQMAFKKMFSAYLKYEYDITEEQFKSILKNAAPEEFI